MGTNLEPFFKSLTKSSSSKDCVRLKMVAVSMLEVVSGGRWCATVTSLSDDEDDVPASPSRNSAIESCVFTSSPVDTGSSENLYSVGTVRYSLARRMLFEVGQYFVDARR